MEIGKIAENKITEASALTESRDFPELRRETQSISLFGSQGKCYALKEGRLYDIDSGMVPCDTGVQSVAGGINCYAWADGDGKAHFVNKKEVTDVFDGLCDIRHIVSDGKENFYLIDAAGHTFIFNTKSKLSKKVMDKEICMYDDYSEMFTTSSREKMIQLRSKNWAESWLKESSFYKDAVAEYGAENVGFKIYESNRDILSDTPGSMQAYITISFAVFTVKDERISPIARSDKKIYIPGEGAPVYVNGGMYTDASDTELFVKDSVKKIFFTATETAAGRYSAFASVKVIAEAATKKPRTIKKGLMLQNDGALKVFDAASRSWLPASIPVKSICDIALYGKDYEYVAVSKTNGEIIMTKYSALLNYLSSSSVKIIRLP